MTFIVKAVNFFTLIAGPFLLGLYLGNLPVHGLTAVVLCSLVVLQASKPYLPEFSPRTEEAKRRVEKHNDLVIMSLCLIIGYLITFSLQKKDFVISVIKMFF